MHAPHLNQHKDNDRSAARGFGRSTDQFEAVSHLSTASPDTPVYRKADCACGGGCPTCQAKSSNLKISQPHDPAEIEADRVAGTVMRMAGDQSLPKTSPENITPAIQPKREGGTNIAGKELSSKISSSQGRGSNLDNGTQSFMQNRFGRDFSGVTIHTGGEAVQMNREINAKAFTVGSDIYFNEGQYKPDSESGRYLLAHELTHVCQQNSGPKMISKAGEEEPVPAQSEPTPSTPAPSTPAPSTPAPSAPAPSAPAPAAPQADPADAADPCTYAGTATKEREVHLNLALSAVRVYTKAGSGHTHTQFSNLILGPSTTQLARQNGWCHMYPVQGHQRRSAKGLINFVNYCGNFGFHSNFWRKDDAVERIPGTQSHGCARLNDADNASTGSGDSNQFYDLVQNGDCVRLYSRGTWRVPTFKPCQSDGDCTLS